MMIANIDQKKLSEGYKMFKLMGWKTKDKWDVEKVKIDLKIISVFIIVCLVIYAVEG